MKNQIILFIVLTLCIPAIAQIPQKISYQGIARNGNQVIANTQVNIEFKIHQGSPTGSVVYGEEHSPTTNAYGLFTVEIGTGFSQINDFTQINWATGDKYLEVKLDGASMGATQLISVPYSLHSNHAIVADSIAGGQWWVPGTFTDPIFPSTIYPTLHLNYTDTLNRSVLHVGQSGNQLAPNLFFMENGSFIASDPTGIFTTHSPYGLYSADNNFGGNTSVSPTSLAVSGPFNYTAIYDGNVNMNSGGATRHDTYVYTSGAIESFYSGNGMSVNINSGPLGGFVNTYGPNGTSNCFFSSPLNYPDNGYMGVNNSVGTIKAGVYVNASGQGVVFGDTKSFVVDHPTKTDKQIWYACIEGPEAAMYERGTARVVNGKATIELSEEFKLLAASGKITIQLTPLSGNSKGLAVVEKSTTQFIVVELMNGNGTYDFDWEVKAIRKGYENWQVVRDRSELHPNEQIVPDAPQQNNDYDKRKLFYQNSK